MIFMMLCAWIAMVVPFLIIKGIFYLILGRREDISDDVKFGIANIVFLVAGIIAGIIYRDIGVFLGVWFLGIFISAMMLDD